MLVDVLDALPLIAKRKPTKLRVAALLAIILVLRDWYADRDGSDYRVRRRVDNGDCAARPVGYVDARAIRRDGNARGQMADRDGGDHCMRVRVNDPRLCRYRS